MICAGGIPNNRDFKRKRRKSFGFLLFSHFIIVSLHSKLNSKRMIKSITINIGYQAKQDNAGGNGLIGNSNVQTPCGQGV
ncbi:hypothetical protein DXD25_02065 [Prevotella sp. TF12-30]|jgi:hypothetical protein|nr:hypothetical protein DXD25_02065 [Prevotella sp. TF12-30]